MKCYVCGYEDSLDAFYEVFVTIPHSDFNAEIHVKGEEESVEDIIYACPKCGALKINVEAGNDGY
jgi:Zn finger protein HypA/HybF involved in hydrogenase expression